MGVTGEGTRFTQSFKTKPLKRGFFDCGAERMKSVWPLCEPRLARVTGNVGPWGRRIHPIYIHVIMYM